MSDRSAAERLSPENRALIEALGFTMPPTEGHDTLNTLLDAARAEGSAQQTATAGELAALADELEGVESDLQAMNFNERNMSPTPGICANTVSRVASRLNELAHLSSPVSGEGWRPSREEVAALIVQGVVNNQSANEVADAVMALSPPPVIPGEDKGSVGSKLPSPSLVDEPANRLRAVLERAEHRANGGYNPGGLAAVLSDIREALGIACEMERA